MRETIIYFFITTLLAFSITGIDKWLAIKQKSRVSEKTLLLLVAIGGTLGSALAMLLFRHKTSKLSYLWKFFAIVIVQIAIIVMFINKEKWF